MKDVKLIEHDYEKRLSQILDESWMIFKSQFAYSRNVVSTEAPFQHHFAHIIRNVGELYSLDKNDLFKTDLEVCYKDEEAPKFTKYIDITCEFINNFFNKSKCAIELKFKTQEQGAFPRGQIQAYIDLEALEKITKCEYNIGKFYMITDSEIYTKSSKGVGCEFEMKDGHKAEGGFYKAPEWKGCRDVTLKNSYIFEWEKIQKEGKDWYFLELTVCR